MRSRDVYWGILGLGLAGMVLLARPAVRMAPPGPTSVRDVQELAHRLGLHYRAETPDGVIRSRVILAVRPLTVEQAASLVVGDPNHPSMAGCAMVSFPPPVDCGMSENLDAVRWGGASLAGDPALVRRLIEGE